ncbi:MAG: hypothetical protein ACREB5_11975 [Sphingomonadaceae bacterium]
MGVQTIRGGGVDGGKARPGKGRTADSIGGTDSVAGAAMIAG